MKQSVAADDGLRRADALGGAVARLAFRVLGDRTLGTAYDFSN